MIKKHQRGFTLIELLVVIAIIGILAALVLVALGNARDKANDAAIKSDLGQLRTLAEVYYDSNSSTYTDWGTCITTPSTANCATAEISNSVTTLKADILAKSANTGALTATSGASAFCMVATLKTGNTVCVDATGEFQETSGGTCTSNVCS